VRHLLKQVEIYKSKRSQRDVRPEWVTAFIDEVAELFDPVADEGRVGFDCHLSEEGWSVGLYLGGTELVGGPRDGQSQHAGFQFDLLPLLDRFSEIERFRWSVFPEGREEGDATALSFVTIEGRVRDNRLRLRIHSIPPADAGPGFRQFPDGRCEPA
jgi:hypothetical protein